MLMEKMDSSVQLNQRYAQLLKAARKKQGVTQWQLAEKLGCQQPLVAKIERAARRLDVAESWQWPRPSASIPAGSSRSCWPSRLHRPHGVDVDPQAASHRTQASVHQ